MNSAGYFHFTIIFLCILIGRPNFCCKYEQCCLSEFSMVKNSDLNFMDECKIKIEGESLCNYTVIYVE